MTRAPPTRGGAVRRVSVGRGGGHPPVRPTSVLTRLDQLSAGVLAAALSLSLAICHLRCFLGRDSAPPALQRPGECAPKSLGDTVGPSSDCLLGSLQTL